MEDRGQLELSTMEISALQQKTVGLEEECEEKSKMAKEWYDALQVQYSEWAHRVCMFLGYTHLD